MAVKTDPYTFTNGTTADALQVNARFDELYSLQNGTVDADNIDKTDDYTWTGTHQFTAAKLKVTGAGAGISTLQNYNTATSRTHTLPDVTDVLVPVPIGTIIAFYDFNAALTFSTVHWAYCDGSTATVGGSSRTLPDLSNRYLVGFGTEGGGDIDTASWATAAVGNASHQVDISHTHTGPSHSHNFSSGVAQASWENGDEMRFMNVAGGFATNKNVYNIAGNIQTLASSGSYGINVTGNVDAAGTGATGSSLSSTQSIQPRSIRVRWIMRIA